MLGDSNALEVAHEAHVCFAFRTLIDHLTGKGEESASGLCLSCALNAWYGSHLTGMLPISLRISPNPRGVWISRR